MKRNFSITPITQVIAAALVVVALVGVAAVASNYQGQIDFNFGPDGVHLGIEGGNKTEQ